MPTPCLLLSGHTKWFQTVYFHNYGVCNQLLMPCIWALDLCAGHQFRRTDPHNHTTTSPIFATAGAPCKTARFPSWTVNISTYLTTSCIGLFHWINVSSANVNHTSCCPHVRVQLISVSLYVHSLIANNLLPTYCFCYICNTLTFVKYCLLEIDKTKEFTN